MQKKYQIFVSSTFTDLIEERQAALKAILDVGHIPSGMEGFFAADQEQLAYIKRIIDECDYYVLIIAGRYGSIDSQGISYTEREYEHAVWRKVPILAFIHKDPASLPISKVEMDPVSTEALAAFEKKVCDVRMVSFWRTKDELQAQIVIALLRFINESPRTGWVRGNVAASDEARLQLSEAKAEVASVSQELRELKVRLQPMIEDIAGLSDSLVIRYKRRVSQTNQSYIEDAVHASDWRAVFLAVGPSLFSPKSPGILGSCLENLIRELTGNYVSSIARSDLDRVKVQLIALNLIDANIAQVVNGGVAEFLTITDMGKRVLIEQMAARKV